MYIDKTVTLLSCYTSAVYVSVYLLICPQAVDTMCDSLVSHVAIQLCWL